MRPHTVEKIKLVTPTVLCENSITLNVFHHVSCNNPLKPLNCFLKVFILDLLAGLISSPPKPLLKKKKAQFWYEAKTIFRCSYYTPKEKSNKFFLPTCTVFCHAPESPQMNISNSGHFELSLFSLKQHFWLVPWGAPTFWWMFFSASTHSEEIMSTTVLQDKKTRWDSFMFKGTE